MGFVTNGRKLRFEKKYNLMVDDEDLEDFSDFGSTRLILSFIFAIISSYYFYLDYSEPMIYGQTQICPFFLIILSFYSVLV